MQKRLEEFRRHIKGLFFRTNFKWIKQSENIFSVLKKRNYVNKTVGKLMYSNGFVITYRKIFQQKLRGFIKKKILLELKYVDIESTFNKNYNRELDENMSNYLEDIKHKWELIGNKTNMENHKEIMVFLINIRGTQKI